MIQDIPKLYTALAEWLACVLFVRLLPQRYNAAKTAGILAAALPLFGLVQWLIGIVPLSLWIPGMIVALVLMYATIWLCCRLNFCDTGFWWALAFTLAEFVASLEWQLYSFGASKMPGSWWIQGLFLLAFYGGGFGVFLRLEQKRLRDKAPLHMTRRESISAAVIAICTFLISNISYVTTNTPFSGRMTTEIFWIRTLVDFAGVAVLLSMQDRWQDMQTQHELTAIQTLLKRQYTAKTANQDIMQWIREGGLFVIVCNLITVFKYILLQFLPAAFANMPKVDFGWPGIEVTMLGATFKWNILGYDAEHGGLPYFCAYMIAMILGEVINFPIQRNVVFRSKGNLTWQIVWYAVAFCVITCIVNSINCIWVATAARYVPDFIYNIGTTVLNGGVSMVIFFFVNKVIFPTSD